MTVLDEDAVADAARRLLEAERSREPIRQLSLQYPDMTIEDAYRVPGSAERRGRRGQESAAAALRASRAELWRLASARSNGPVQRSPN